MKNTIIGGIFVLLAAVTTALFGHYLAKENIDVRYTLSDSIPAKFAGKGSLSNIQQLDIINSSDKPALQIGIKLDGHITQYELTKYSAIDKVVENFSDKKLEILYPELAPGGKIKIVFSSEVIPLNKKNINIYHSKGVGKEAFDKKNSLFFSISFIQIFLTLSFIILIIAESFTLKNRWIERDAYRGDEKIFNKIKSPLFMSVDRWNQLRKEAIENYIKKSSLYSYDIENSKVVNILNSDKPEYLKDHEWEFLIEKAQYYFAEKFQYFTGLSFYYEQNVDRYFKVSKPKNFQQNKWDEILKKLHELYIYNLKVVALNKAIFAKEKDIYSELKVENIYNVTSNLWDEYKKFLNKIYYISIINGLYKQLDNHIEYINNHDLSSLDETDAYFIKNTAYKLQKNSRFIYPFTFEKAQEFLKKGKEVWLEEVDYIKIELMAQEIVNSHDEKNKINAIKKILDCIIFRQTFPEKKPSELGSEDWIELTNIQKDIGEIINENEKILFENRKILSEIEQKEKTIPILIEKLNFQLSIINEFLSDPSVLDRIEDYNNKFSPGNFQNLKKISLYLKEIKKIN